MKTKKKLVFLTGTRADFGKLKPLINKVEDSDNFDCYVFVTGMHTLSLYGSTFLEVKKQKYKNIFVYMNQNQTTDLDSILANTITGFGNFVKEIKPDLIIIHGDRIEAFAGGIVGTLNNILVSHVEGGELSGTLDSIIRHSLTKLSHIHFVANRVAKRRIIQMGEDKNAVFVIGSPDIDIMLSDSLPTINQVKKRYGIPFNEYAILIFHPVTNELETIEQQVCSLIDSLVESNQNYVVVYPNNDPGSSEILKAYKQLEFNKKFRIIPSLRFEYFLMLLQKAKFIIGNSSAGIREAGIYGVPCINIGTRQIYRTKNENVTNIDPLKYDVLKTIKNLRKVRRNFEFGKGNSSEKFLKTLNNDSLWRIPIQKLFKEHYSK